MFSLFAVWHWLLCSWHLSPFPMSLAILFPAFLSFYTLSNSTWTLDIARASLCVRACVRLYIRV